MFGCSLLLLPSGRLLLMIAFPLDHQILTFFACIICYPPPDQNYPKEAYPPAAGYPPPQYVTPPPQAGYPPQYATPTPQAVYPPPPPPQHQQNKQVGCMEGCLAALCCCCVMDACFDF